MNGIIGIDPPCLVYDGFIFQYCSIALAFALYKKLSGLPTHQSPVAFIVKDILLGECNFSNSFVIYVLKSLAISY